MPKIYTTVGIPGSGKTTAVKKLLEKNPLLVVISSDSIRKELTGSEVDMSQDSMVWNTLYKRTEEAVAEGKDVIIDATFVSVKSRKRHHENLYKAISLGGKIIYLCSNTSFELAVKRNAERERVVPEHVLRSMWSSFSIPKIDDHPNIEAVFVLETSKECPY